MSLTFNGANHIAGPAIVTWNSQTWYSQGDITVDIQQATWEPTTARFGAIGTRVKSVPVAKVSFTPSGMITSGLAAKAFPYTAADVGKSIFTATDKPLTIQTLAGSLYTFQKAGLSGVPAMVLAADETFFSGNLEFICIGKTNTDMAAASTFVAITSSAFSDVSFDETKVLTPGYTAAWSAGTGLTAIETLTGFRLECPIRTQELSVNRIGVVDVHLTSVGPASCRFSPAGMTEAVWLTLVNLDGASISLPGATPGGGATDLVITGTGIVVTLPKCGVTASKLGYGASRERLGEVVFQNRTVFTTGVPANPITIAVS